MQRERAEENSALPPNYYFCFGLMASMWCAVKRKVTSTSPFRISASRFSAQRFFIHLCGPVELFFLSTDSEQVGVLFSTSFYFLLKFSNPI